MTAIETERTRLRPLTPADADKVLMILSDPEAMQYSPAGVAQDRAAAEGLIRWNQENHRVHGLGVWAVVSRRTDEFLGLAGLIPQPVGVEIFCSFVRRRWGQGLATEVGAACRDYGLQPLRKTRLIAIIHPENSRAINVARKLGLRDVGTIEFWGRTNRLFEIRPADQAGG